MTYVNRDAVIAYVLFWFAYSTFEYPPCVSELSHKLPSFEFWRVSLFLALSRRNREASKQCEAMLSLALPENLYICKKA